MAIKISSVKKDESLVGTCEEGVCFRDITHIVSCEKYDRFFREWRTTLVFVCDKHSEQYKRKAANERP